MINQRVRYLLDEGEPLTLPRHAVHQVMRFGIAQKMLGIDSENLVFSPAVSVPFPRYANDRPLRGTFPIASSALRYPFMWLPPALHERYELAGADGETTLESDLVWALRVALEMFASGAFNASTGGWIDILALYDLDPDNPETDARIQRWWNGENDEELDAIDITEMFEVDDEADSDWAIVSASTLEPLFRNASYALAAFDLLTLLDLVADGKTAALGGGTLSESLKAMTDIAKAIYVDSPQITASLGEAANALAKPWASDARALREVGPLLRETLAVVGETYLPDLAGVVESDVARETEGAEADARPSQDEETRHGRRRALTAVRGQEDR